MSKQAIRAVMDSGLPTGPKFVLVALSLYLKDAERGESVLSQRSISALTTISERSVRRHMLDLEELGLLVREQRFRRNGTRTSDRVSVDLSKLPSDVAVDPPPDTVTGGHDGRDHRTPCPPPPDTMSGHIEVRGDVRGVVSTPGAPDGAGVGADLFDADVVQLPGTVTDEDISSAFDAWNEVAGRLGLDPVDHKTAPRRRALVARFREYGLESWPRILAALEAKPFYRGAGPGGWRADFNWVVTPKNFVALLEAAATKPATDAVGDGGEQMKRIRAMANS